MRAGRSGAYKTLLAKSKAAPSASMISSNVKGATLAYGTKLMPMLALMARVALATVLTVLFLVRLSVTHARQVLEKWTM